MLKGRLFTYDLYIRSGNHQLVTIAVKSRLVNGRFSTRVETAIVIGMVGDQVMQIPFWSDAEGKDQQHQQRRYSLYDRVAFQLGCSFKKNLMFIYRHIFICQLAQIIGLALAPVY